VGREPAQEVKERDLRAAAIGVVSDKEEPGAPERVREQRRE
jgi:hypothetical protein